VAEGRVRGVLESSTAPGTSIFRVDINGS